MAGAGLAVCAWAAGSVLAKGIDMDGVAVAVYRFGLFSLVIVGWLRARGEPFSLEIMRRSAFGGIALGCDVALFFTAIKLTNVVNATLIGSLQPIFVGVIAARFFGEKIVRRDILWSLVAVLGVGLVVVASNGTPEWSATGDLFALAAMVSWGLYFIASKRSNGAMSPTEFTAGTAVWATCINIPIGVAFGQDLSWPSATSWGWLILMTLLAGVVGHSLMNWSLVRIPLWIGSTFTLLIPVASSIIAWVALDEALNRYQIGAMGLVLLALAVIVRNQSRPDVGETSGAGRSAALKGAVGVGPSRLPAGFDPTLSAMDPRSAHPTDA